ncbi:anti-sigma factor antagonist [Streptomyces sp. NPDC094472]|uniref:anti-sigma factor antagonist n=1 Tax=unclassified Streptomyces TaxID=2593676 RepID=UPI00332534C3
MTQQGAPRDAPVPLERGAQNAAQGSASGDPAAWASSGRDSATRGPSGGDSAAQGDPVAQGDAAAQRDPVAWGDPVAQDGAAADVTAPRARTHRVGGYTVVELHGEIDIAGVGSVGPALDAATAGDKPAVIVDLRTAAFFDCSGLGLLCRAHRRVVERAGRMRLVCDNALILRTLRAGRMLDVLRPVATLDEALRAEE